MRAASAASATVGPSSPPATSAAGSTAFAAGPATFAAGSTALAAEPTAAAAGSAPAPALAGPVEAAGRPVVMTACAALPARFGGQKILMMLMVMASHGATPFPLGVLSRYIVMY